MAHSERLFLIDGMAIAYRSYFAFFQRPLTNAKGENTSAIFGFVNFLTKIIQEEHPEHLAVVFDTSAPTFRHKEYKEYKATRQKMPDDLLPQLEVIKGIVRAYGVPLIEVDGYEADDVMGTLARRAEKEGVETYLVTPDKDFMQLVSDRVKIYRPGRQGTDVEIIGLEEVEKKFGVGPERVVDVLALMGDTSDNVPGVSGIGEKTAIPLVQQYGSVENILDRLDEIPQQGIRKKLETDRANALLSKRLVTIDTAAPVPIDFHELRPGEADIQKLRDYFKELDFKTFLKRLAAPVETPVKPESDSSFGQFTTIATDEHTYRILTTIEELRAVVSRLANSKRFVFDTETTGTDPLRAEIVGLSFATQPREAFYLPLWNDIPREDREGATPTDDLFGKSEKKDKSRTTERVGLPIREALTTLKPAFENPHITKVGQNIKYDILVLSAYDVEVKGPIFDTMIASYLLRADGQHNLDALAREYLSYSMVSYDELTGTGKNRVDIRDLPLQSLADYSCEDADITLRLSEVLRKRLQQEGMEKLCNEIEFPLCHVLARMERAGVAIDVPFLEDMSKELERLLDNLTREIHRLAGRTFNINSTQQLGEILFTHLGLPPVRKTKTGYSTDVGVLEALRGAHPIVEQLLEYRQLTKLRSTYVDALPRLIHPRTGRVHTSFNQTVAATGRLSSSDPNLQNIPIRTELGRSIRKAFIPGGPDRLIMSADYSQIELRVMAHVSGDEGLAEAFRKGEDIHTTTAAKVFGVAPEEVTREMRRKAKEVNFGIMYGIGPFGLASRLEISQAEAKEIIDRYFERFPGVSEYIERTKEGARTKGYVETLLGRRRYLPDIHSRNQNVRQNAERQAINMPIQGTAADMIKRAMVNIDRAVQEEGLRSAMILQVHDELVFDMVMSEETRLRSLVTECMQTAIELSVPLVVEIGVGKNWLEAH